MKFAQAINVERKQAKTKNLGKINHLWLDKNVEGLAKIVE